MRVGILGGTFDPPHLGHLVVAREVAERVGLDRVLLIPAAIPPHKRGREITPGPLRLEMLHAAIAGRSGLEASDLELRRGGTSFTVDTLRELGRTDPDAELFLILGADQAAELDTWRESDEVRRRATIVAVRRAGESGLEPETTAAPGVASTASTASTPGMLSTPGTRPTGAIEVDIPRLDISSTDIRRRVGAGESIEFLVPDAVVAIVEREGLYRDEASTKAQKHRSTKAQKHRSTKAQKHGGDA